MSQSPEIPIVGRPCMLHPMEHPDGCDRESCPLYFDTLTLIESLSYETRLSQGEVMERLGDPNHPVLYVAWQVAMRRMLGERIKLCRFEQAALPPGESEQPLLP